MASNFAFVFDGGATVKNLLTDYNVNVTGWTGGGMAPQRNITVPYALGDGSAFQRTIVDQRVIQLACTPVPTMPFSMAAIHSKRKAIINAINRDVLNSGTFTLRYYGAGATSVDIPVRYNGGLELDSAAVDPMQAFSISLLACDPFWRTSAVITETFAAAGAVSNSGYIASRASDGTWTGLSGTNSPAAGATQILYANSKLYVAAGSHLYVRAAGTWTDYTANAAVNCLCLAPDGTTIYVGGLFTAINSVSTNYFATLAGTTFSAVTGAPGEIRSLGLGTVLYAVSRVSSATKLYWWDSATTWTAIDTRSSTNNPPVNTMSVYHASVDAVLYVTDNTANDLVVFLFGPVPGASLETIATAALGSIKAYIWNPNVESYIGGSFTTITTASAGAVTTAGIYPAVTGSATTVNAIAFFGTTIYAGGTFTGYLKNTNAWASIGAVPAAAVTALFVDQATGTLYASWNSASNMTAGSDLTKSIVNVGDRDAFPTIVITRTGGTSATLTAITNTFTGKSLLFNYAMGAGEVITITLTPGSRSIRSSSGADLAGLLLPGSSFGTWAISPGTRVYTISVTGVGSPTMSAVATYSGSYQSADSVAA